MQPPSLAALNARAANRAGAEVEGSTVPRSSNGGLVTLRGSHAPALPATRPASFTPPVGGRQERRASGRPVEPGDWIGDVYCIQEKLGGGSMGQVFSAFDEVLERKVAIKLIRSNLNAVDFRKRFMLEARAMALVSHPNV